MAADGQTLRIDNVRRLLAGAPTSVVCLASCYCCRLPLACQARLRAARTFYFLSLWLHVVDVVVGDTAVVDTLTLSC